jgi:ribosomal protein S18 acetylase RimI-like enzyme
MREVSLKHTELSDISNEILKRGGLFRFKAHGSSMYPFIQDGDVLTVQPVEIDALNIGDVAFYRSTGDRVVAHRVVGKNSTNGQWVLTMGRVMTIQRGQKIIQLDEKFWKLASHLWITSYPIGAAFLKTETKSKKIAAYFLSRVQALKPYRSIARKLFRNKISYRIATDEDITGLSKFYCYGKLSNIADPIDLSEQAFRSLEGDGHTLIACFRGKIIGATVITRFPDDEVSYPDWWIFGMTVRIPYRGMGIGDGLVVRAMEKASEEGARRLNLLVYEKNKAAVNLYHKTGFRQISIPALDKELEEEAKQTNQRRIILSKEL